MALDPGRTVAELRELQALTGDAEGAQRVCWTPTWARARDFLREKLAELPVGVERDEAGNLWATLGGESERALLIGGHLDSVSNGGWLDGCLNVLSSSTSSRGRSSSASGYRWESSSARTASSATSFASPGSGRTQEPRRWTCGGIP